MADQDTADTTASDPGSNELDQEQQQEPHRPGAGRAEPTAGQQPAAEPVAAPAPPSAEQHPERWGRVDTDGTVYVRTADGERAVGSWQAGEPSEGLVHFARRFDDLRTECELLHSRLESGNGDPKQALTSAKHLRESLADAAVVGDLAGTCPPGSTT